MNDEKIKNLIGKPYLENKQALKYGGAVNSNGIIVEALTKEESENLKSNCPADKPNLNAAEDLKNWVWDDELDQETHIEDIIDTVLEFLHDQQFLNEKGESLVKGFWERYIHSDASVLANSHYAPELITESCK